MEIETGCVPEDETDDELKLEFTQNGQKCTIDPLTPQDMRCNTNSYQSGDPNVGTCTTFDFASAAVEGHVTYADLSSSPSSANDDGWGPESIKLFLNNGIVILCLEFGIGIIDTNTPGEPTSLSFTCQPGIFSLSHNFLKLKVLLNSS